VDGLEAINADVSSLVSRVAAQATPRQLRLFAVACCRLVWDRMTSEASRTAVEVAERFADGLATVADLDAVRRPAYQVRGAGDLRNLPAEAAQRDSGNAARMAAHVLSYAARDDRIGQLLVLLDVFGNTPFRGLTNRDCDIHGNDFQGVRFVPEWRTTTVRAIAEGIYVSHDFSGMPVLADALEESGCDHPSVLAHCRSCRPHYRGCWVLDGLLARAEPFAAPDPAA
jgi:hypothetical protein